MKNKKDLRIVFMGTPDFAVTALDALLRNNFKVVAVVTNIDKKSGRGLKTTPSAVKQFAIEKGIPVLQPKNLKATDFIEELKSYKADVQVVVAFRMLPIAVWDMPALGTINIHASLLPDYRGAAPINWAIMNGETKTGITTFQLKHKIDTGDILLQTEVAILPNENAGTLHDKLAILGGDLISKTLETLCTGNLEAKEQTYSAKDKKAPKIFKDDCKIDWNKSSSELNNFIRGLSPYPAAYTFFDDKKVKVFASAYSPNDKEVKNGTIISDNKNYIKIACKDGWIELLEIQVQGKKRMKVEDYLRGNRM